MKVLQSIFGLSKNTIKLTAHILILLSLIFGFFSRICSVFTYTTFDIGQSPDQVRDAFVYMKMWQGIWPTLGPASSVGGYSLPPLYYYVVFPFTTFGANPIFQALPNALFSFLTIPLLILLVYQLLENNKPSKRIFLAGLAGFWYALLFVDIFLSTFEWNPSPIPFFLLSFVLLYKYQLEANSPMYFQIFSWVLYGLNLAFLICLHSTTLFVMPVAFAISSILYIYKNLKNPRRWLLPGISGFSAVISLLPYWKGEISRHWSNSKEIVSTILHSSNEVHNPTIWERLSRIIFNYLELGRQAYFIGSSWWHNSIAVLFLSLVLILAIAKFKGNLTIFTFLLFIWSIYLYAASNYGERYITHYKMLILLAPIIFTVLSFAYLDYSTRIGNLLSYFLILGVILSILSNINWNYRYLDSKYGQEKLITSSDMIQIVQQLPVKATVCPLYRGYSRKKYHPFKYIDTYITKKELKFVDHYNCQSGNYVLFPKYKLDFLRNDNLGPAFKISRSKTFNKKADIFLETPVAYVYVLK